MERDDDLHNSYYHTVSVEHLEAGVDAQGKPVAWLHRTAAPTIFSTFNPEAKHEATLEFAMGVINVPFAIPNVRVGNPEAVAHTRIGWFQSVSNVPHAFAVSRSWPRWRRRPGAIRRTSSWRSSARRAW